MLSERFKSHAIRCIVIDDNQDIVDVLCDLLGMLNVDVLATANSGKDVVNLYEKYKPDIVFTALEMPQYDGLYVVETIKDLNFDARLVAIVGNSIAGTTSDLFDLLHIPVMHKSFDIHKMKQIISDVLDENDSITAFKIQHITAFKIQYRFKGDISSNFVTVTYPQYRNLKKLPSVEECKIIHILKNSISRKNTANELF